MERASIRADGRYQCCAPIKQRGGSSIVLPRTPGTINPCLRRSGARTEIRLFSAPERENAFGPASSRRNERVLPLAVRINQPEKRKTRQEKTKASWWPNLSSLSLVLTSYHCTVCYHESRVLRTWWVKGPFPVDWPLCLVKRALKVKNLGLLVVLKAWPICLYRPLSGNFTPRFWHQL
jgi:hypothetical protein